MNFPKLTFSDVQETLQTALDLGFTVREIPGYRERPQFTKGNKIIWFFGAQWLVAIKDSMGKFSEPKSYARLIEAIEREC